MTAVESAVFPARWLLRAGRSCSNNGGLLASHRGEMKPEAVAKIEAGATDLAKAMTTQAQVMQRMREFQERCAFLACAVNPVPPFDATLDRPRKSRA